MCRASPSLLAIAQTGQFPEATGDVARPTPPTAPPRRAVCCSTGAGAETCAPSVTMVRSEKIPRARPSANATKDAPSRSARSTTVAENAHLVVAAAVVFASGALSCPGIVEAKSPRRRAVAVHGVLVGAGDASAAEATQRVASTRAACGAADAPTEWNAGGIIRARSCCSNALPSGKGLRLHWTNCRRSARALDAISPRETSSHPCDGVLPSAPPTTLASSRAARKVQVPSGSKHGHAEGTRKWTVLVAAT